MVNIKVAVRIRPFSQREVNQKDESIVQTSDKSILITNLKVPEVPNGDSRQRVRKFAVDYCYDPKYPDACTQESVYQDVGKEILDSMFNGYNACVLAYGHSASGKTYTMMGEEDDPGLTPRICQGLFRRMNEKALTTRVKFTTVISFLEIYNERVRDLLVSDESGATAGSNFSLRVREHPKLGPYVQDLSQHVVNDEDGILEYLAIGNSRRSTAATENNIHSSRSHAVFTIRFKQTDELNFIADFASKVHLVDLAGSERAGATQSRTRLKEGANINKSLVTLGNVISALAESCETNINSKDQVVTKTWQPFVPYRDSVLTWLLKDTLGGNSNTIMIATVSPASSCLNETINTLRYAKRTKRIVNQPIINEDPKVRTIRELREEIEKLRNVIFTLQIKNENSVEGEVTSSKSEKGEEKNLNGAGQIKNSHSSEIDNCKIIRKESENNVINGLDILPGLNTSNERNNAKTHGEVIRTANTNSFTVNVSKINDEKKTDVNGSVIDKLVNESQVFSGSLSNFSVLDAKASNLLKTDGVELREEPRTSSAVSEIKSRKRHQITYKGHKESQIFPKISRASKFRISSRRQARHRLRLYFKRNYNSLENLSLSKMLHRSRPDLIKGIAAHSKDGLPSTSSQSFTDVSGLSQSASENSLNSSGSVDSQNSENKTVRTWPEKNRLIEDNMTEKLSKAMRKSTSRQSSIGEGSGSSTPTQIPKLVSKRRADRRSEIVAAVTTRLYATKKKPDPRMEALQAAEKDDDDDGELEELKLCKRARMKLFDLSRKLAMAKRIKKTADSDTQTDFANATVRVKEKSVITDQSGVVQYENCSTNTPLDNPLKEDKVQPVIMNQVFIPRFSNYVVECGKNVRVEPGNRRAVFDSSTQTITTHKDQMTSPAAQSPNEDNFSDDSLDEEEFLNWKKNCEADSLELDSKSVTGKSGVKSQSNENFSFTKPLEPITLSYRRSYDSLIDGKLNKPVDRSWLPITRYPIAGTNALYEYDPNKLAPDVIYGNLGNKIPDSKPEDTSYNKIRKTEIVFPLFNGLPLAICTETVSGTENNAEDARNFVTSISSLLQSEENASSENSVASNDSSDVTSSSESSEDFVFYVGPREKEMVNRQSGLGNLYTISENSEVSDVTASDSSSPQTSQHSSLQFLEQKKEKKSFVSFSAENGQCEGPKVLEEETVKNNGINKDYTVGVHVLRNPHLTDFEVQERVDKSNLQDYNHTAMPAITVYPQARTDGSSSVYADSSVSSHLDFEQIHQPGTTESNPSLNSFEGTQKLGQFISRDTSDKMDQDNKHHQKQQKKSPPEKVKKINWSDLQTPSQRQFLNFNILGSSKPMPFSIDSNMFGEKKQSSEAKSPSEDSITFVFMGPNRQKTSMLMEIIKQSLGQGSCSEMSLGEKSHKKSRNRGVQCKMMRSVSVDTAMIALSRFAKHQRPVTDIARTSSLDTLVPEEMQNILEQGRLHGIRENGCQCDLDYSRSEPKECHCLKPQIMKYTTCTSTTRDQGTETDKALDVVDKCCMMSALVDVGCDAIEDPDDNLFDEFFPPLPRTKVSGNASRTAGSKWEDVKDIILGTSQYLRDSDDEKPKSPRKTNKSVSWSDFSDCEELLEGNSVPQKEPSGSEQTSDTKDELLISEPVLPQDISQTRRVRFTEPQRPFPDNACDGHHEKRETAQTAMNVTEFLEEAVKLLKNLNQLSRVYDFTESDKNQKIGVKSSLKKVETSVQTEGQRLRDIPLDCSIRKTRTVSAITERRDRKGVHNLTWPRQRPVSGSSPLAIGKPPTGLRSASLLKSPLSLRTPSTHSSFDILKNDIETSSTSTNWNISNLSTTFSNSYFGDSGCSRPSSSKSFYSDKERGTSEGSKYWSQPKILSPRLHRPNTDLEMDLEDSCRRLELTVENDRLREENLSLKLTSLNKNDYKFNLYNCGDKSDAELKHEDSNKSKNEDSVSNIKYNGGHHSVFLKNPTAITGKSFESKTTYTYKKPCKCYCHYRTNKVYRSSLELEAQLSVDRHCHACCTPCDAEPERSNSAPVLNSVCEDNKCRLFYYGYCPCSSVKLQHVKSSPRAYMQHLLSLRRQIVKNTYDSANT